MSAVCLLKSCCYLFLCKVLFSNIGVKFLSQLHLCWFLVKTLNWYNFPTINGKQRIIGFIDKKGKPEKQRYREKNAWNWHITLQQWTEQNISAWALNNCRNWRCDDYQMVLASDQITSLCENVSFWYSFFLIATNECGH